MKHAAIVPLERLLLRMFVRSNDPAAHATPGGRVPKSTPFVSARFLMAPGLKRLLAIALLAASPAVLAAPCLPGTLADYISLGSCEIGATQFAGFASLSDLPAGSTPIPATAIAVTPLMAIANPGFTFTLNAAASASEILSTLIQFQVLAGVGLTLGGGSAAIAGSSATGDGVSLLIEDLCIERLDSARCRRPVARVRRLQ